MFNRHKRIARLATRGRRRAKLPKSPAAIWLEDAIGALCLFAIGYMFLLGGYAIQ